MKERRVRQRYLLLGIGAFLLLLSIFSIIFFIYVQPRQLRAKEANYKDNSKIAGAPSQAGKESQSALEARKKNEELHKNDGTSPISLKRKLAILKKETPVFLYKSNSCSGEIVAILPVGGGGEVEVTGDTWYLLKSGEYTGFVKKDQFIVGKRAERYAKKHFGNRAIVSALSAFVYEKASGESPVLGIFPKGTELLIEKEKNGFYPVHALLKPSKNDGDPDTDDAVIDEADSSANCSSASKQKGSCGANSDSGNSTSDDYGVLDDYKAQIDETPGGIKEDTGKTEKEATLSKDTPIVGYLDKNALAIAPDLSEAVEADFVAYADYFPEESYTTFESDEEYDAAQEPIYNQNPICEDGYDDFYDESCQSVIDYALQFVGNPYVWGGEDLVNGCDCSGFIMKIYEHFGISLPHGSWALRTCGTLVTTQYDESVMRPGDIICYNGHVVLYMGNGKCVQAACKKLGIIVSKVDKTRPIICVRRVMYGHSSYGDVSDEDFEALCRIVEAEAGSEGRQGKIYVADVILNRVRSPKFKNTIQGVILSKHQFQPVSNGRYYSVKVTEETKRAVKYALTHTDSTQGALYFMNPTYSDPDNVRWFYSDLTYLFSYGPTEFFR